MTGAGLVEMLLSVVRKMGGENIEIQILDSGSIAK